MSFIIDTVDINLAERMAERVIVRQTGITDMRSIDVNQSTGDFLVCNTQGVVTFFPQSLYRQANSILGGEKILTTFSGFGSLKGVLDAKIDSARGKIWIADTGNNRVLKVDIYSLLAEYAIDNVLQPHCVCSEVNTGGVFIKGSYSATTGIVYHYTANGKLLSSIKYSDNTSIETPLPSTLVFDHRRNRVWWTALAKVYMLDLLNNQTTDFDLGVESIDRTRGIEIHLESGNAFVVAHGLTNAWSVLQIFRDNNAILGYSYLPESAMSPCPY